MAMYAEKLMNYALNDVGVKEVPAGSNKVKFNKWFYGSNVSGSQYPWCCAAVCYWFHHVGFGSLFYGGKKTALCASVESWGRSKGQVVSKNDGRYGDIVTFDFGGSRTCHIGLIIKKNSDGSYKTLEGNTSKSSNDNGGKVMIRTRYKNQIAAIIRPKYTLHKQVAVTGTTHKYADMNVRSKSHGTVSSESKVRFVKDMGNGWSKIISISDGQVSYIKNKYLKKDGLSTYKSAKVVSKTNLRKVPKATGKIVKKNVAVGTAVKVVYKGKSWSNIIINGTSGWVPNKRLKY